MNKIVSLAYANEAGAGVAYTDGSSIKFVASLNITIISDGFDETIVEGRQGI